jgi:hypothetical protein
MQEEPLKIKAALRSQRWLTMQRKGKGKDLKRLLLL